MTEKENFEVGDIVEYNNEIHVIGKHHLDKVDKFKFKIKKIGFTTKKIHSTISDFIKELEGEMEERVDRFGKGSKQRKRYIYLRGKVSALKSMLRILRLFEKIPTQTECQKKPKVYKNGHRRKL